ncbi:spermine synthase [Armatimonas sp.]|uniref:spermine synthase n=1 Tax=Armatimonas sp. TaxID=1872638 RepID=UPI00374D5B87
MSAPIICRWQALPWLVAHEEAAGVESLETTLDLNLTTCTVALTAEGVQFPDGPLVLWDAVREVADHDTGCFSVNPDGTLERAYIFSPTTRRAVSLWGQPEGAPTVLVAGFPMHRTKRTDPWQDTQNKIAACQPVSGRVMDTCMGLGYTAICAAKTAAHVTVIELDAGVEAMAAKNPWSEPLFSKTNITRKNGDAFALIKEMPDAVFDLMIHDPPTMQLAGDLYSGAFYREAFRVLSRRGRLFHYIGDPNSRHGATVTRGVVKRLHESGFVAVTTAADAYGVVAWKEKPRR